MEIIAKDGIVIQNIMHFFFKQFYLQDDHLHYLQY